MASQFCSGRFKRFLAKSSQLILALSLGLVGTGVLSGQIKYEGPEDERIEEMCRRAVSFLESPGRPGPGRDALGVKLLEALTVLEVNKRYEGEVPKDHPIIVSAVGEALEMVNGGGQDALNKQHSMYTPALALILLCEVDDNEYAGEIKNILSYVAERQNDNGGWSYDDRPFITDVSQTQYCCLAIFVAKVHKFRINPEVGKRALNALVQFQQPNDSWVYHYSAVGTPVSNKFTRSLHTSALGTVYLLSDVLQLTPRAKDMRIGAKNGEQVLPPSVTIYIKAKGGEAASPLDKPLVTFDRGKLGGAKAKGNRWLAGNFGVTSDSWGYYYLYALERYAYFREQAETAFSEVPNWYDQGVDHLRGLQLASGAYPSQQVQTTTIATCLATLFLVRSSELLNRPPAEGDLRGGLGFQKGTLKLGKDGRITSQAAVKGVNDMLALLGDATGEDARAILDGMKITAKSIGEGKSRAERLSLLTGMVMDASPIKRLIAIKVLAGEQNMDNVPALLYALGDPDLEIARHAHDGLRLISRRIDAFPLPNNPDYTEFQVVKKKWTDWFLAIRPDAQLID